MSTVNILASELTPGKIIPPQIPDPTGATAEQLNEFMTNMVKTHAPQGILRADATIEDIRTAYNAMVEARAAYDKYMTAKADAEDKIKNATTAEELDALYEQYNNSILHNDPALAYAAYCNKWVDWQSAIPNGVTHDTIQQCMLAEYEGGKEALIAGLTRFIDDKRAELAAAETPEDKPEPEEKPEETGTDTVVTPSTAVFTPDPTIGKISQTTSDGVPTPGEGIVKTRDGTLTGTRTVATSGTTTTPTTTTGGTTTTKPKPSKGTAFPLSPLVASNYVRTYNTFSGADMVVTVQVPFDIQGKNSITKVIGNFQTITYSMADHKAPVRNIGNMNPKTFVFGPRLIAGRLFLTVFDKHWMRKLMKEYKEKKSATEKYYMIDELPPFNITISAGNEYGHAARLALYGVTIIGETCVLSINDVYTEEQFDFYAHQIDYLDAVDVVKSNNKINNTNIPRRTVVTSDGETIPGGAAGSRYTIPGGTNETQVNKPTVEDSDTVSLPATTTDSDTTVSPDEAYIDPDYINDPYLTNEVTSRKAKRLRDVYEKLLDDILKKEIPGETDPLVLANHGKNDFRPDGTRTGTYEERVDKAYADYVTQWLNDKLRQPDATPEDKERWLKEASDSITALKGIHASIIRRHVDAAKVALIKGDTGKPTTQTEVKEEENENEPTQTTEEQEPGEENGDNNKPGGTEVEEIEEQQQEQEEQQNEEDEVEVFNPGGR